MKNLVFFAVVSLFSNYSFAGNVTSDWINIKKIKIGWNVERVNLVFDTSVDAVPNPFGCSVSSEAAIDEDNVNLDRLYSMALAQMTSNRKIQVVVYGDRCSMSGRIKILSVNAQN